MSLPEFHCTKCGACCRNVENISALANYALPNGVCKFLSPGNTCIIYASRPDVCRVDATKPKGFSTRLWYQLNEEACDKVHLLIYEVERPKPCGPSSTDSDPGSKTST